MRTEARRPDRLEHLIRYVARPPIATERLPILTDGRTACTFKKRWRDGAVGVGFAPLTFLERLATLVPRPRKDQVVGARTAGPTSPLRTTSRRAGVPTPRMRYLLVLPGGQVKQRGILADRGARPRRAVGGAGARSCATKALGAGKTHGFRPRYAAVSTTVHLADMGNVVAMNEVCDEQEGRADLRGILHQGNSVRRGADMQARPSSAWNDLRRAPQRDCAPPPSDRAGSLVGGVEGSAVCPRAGRIKGMVESIADGLLEPNRARWIDPLPEPR